MVFECFLLLKDPEHNTNKLNQKGNFAEKLGDEIKETSHEAHDYFIPKKIYNKTKTETVQLEDKQKQLILDYFKLAKDYKNQQMPQTIILVMIIEKSSKKKPSQMQKLVMIIEKSSKKKPSQMP